MKKYVLTALVVGSVAATAQAETFTYEVEFSDPAFVGGLGEGGRYGRGGTMDGNYTTTFSDGRVEKGKADCVGMDQPPGSMFEVHIACTASETSGNRAHIIYGCNSLGENKGYSCVGGIEATAGAQKGARGTLTMHLRRGVSVGTGQWYE